jgi:hypothetical protein
MISLFEIQIPVEAPKKTGIRPAKPGIPLVSEMNTHEHWRKSHARHQKQKYRIKKEFMAAKPKITLPIEIRLTRISPRPYDHDNLVSSFKYIVDAICEYITPGLRPGRADSIPGIDISYHQEKGEPKKYSLKIEIFQK